MPHASYRLVDVKTFCSVCFTILCLAKRTEGEEKRTVFKEINVHVLDANNTLVLLVPMYTTERIGTLYDILAIRQIKLTCLTYNGFHLRKTNTFEDYRIRRDVNFRVETKKCKKALSPSKYFELIYKATSTVLPPDAEDEEQTNFALLVVWTVAVIVIICVSLTAAYYVRTLRRSEQIEKDLADIRKGKTVSSSTSSSTLRTARSVPKQEVVTNVAIELEQTKIEGEGDVPDTGTSSIEVREIKRVPQDQKKI